MAMVKRVKKTVAEVGGTGVEGRIAHGHVFQRGDHDDRQINKVLHALEHADDAEAVELRHAEIGDDQVKRMIGGVTHRFEWPIEGADVDLRRNAGEYLGNQQGVRGLVVDYDYVLAHGLLW